MKEQLKHVEDFHNAFEEVNGTEPQLLNEDTFLLRYRLMGEENGEYLDACWEGNIVGIADALGDQLYILCGTILKHEIGRAHV
jgi:predicted HAD superfamily Cof-like phosphohydrolase